MYSFMWTILNLDLLEKGEVVMYDNAYDSALVLCSVRVSWINTGITRLPLGLDQVLHRTVQQHSHTREGPHFKL